MTDNVNGNLECYEQSALSLESLIETLQNSNNDSTSSRNVEVLSLPDRRKRESAIINKYTSKDTFIILSL